MVIGGAVSKIAKVKIECTPSPFSNIARKVSKYGVLSGTFFPILGLNMEMYFVNPRIQSEYGKKQTRKKLRICTLFTQLSWLVIFGYSR